MSILNQIISHFSNKSYWFIGLSIFIILGVFAHFAANIIIAKLEKKALKTKNLWNHAFTKSIKIPLMFIIWLSVVSGIINFTYLEQILPHLSKTYTLISVFYIIIGSWFSMRFIQCLEDLSLENTKQNNKTDPSTIIAVSKIIRVIILILLVLTIMQTFGFSMSGLLAFGGIGGIAIGFAAKDLLANIFGGVMVHLDNPFKVGDEIKATEKSLEGIVEYIGWRQTRIRTFDRYLVHIPNSAFASMPVSNLTRRQSRRIKSDISVRYQDSTKLTNLLKELRELINNHPDLDHKFTTFIHFYRFGESSLDCLLYCFAKTNKWVRWFEIQEGLFLDIIQIIHKHGADIAFPTTTLNLSQENKEKIKLSNGGITKNME